MGQTLCQVFSQVDLLSTLSAAAGYSVGIRLESWLASAYRRRKTAFDAERANSAPGIRAARVGGAGISLCCLLQDTEEHRTKTRIEIVRRQLPEKYPANN